MAEEHADDRGDPRGPRRPWMSEEIMENRGDHEEQNLWRLHYTMLLVHRPL